MENLRWILIFAGVAILLLLYLSGRQPRAGRNSGGNSVGKKGDKLNRESEHNASTGRASADPLLSDDVFGDPLDDFGETEDMDDLMDRPGGQPAPAKQRKSVPKTESAGGFGSISSTFGALGSKLAPNRRSDLPDSEKAAPQKPQASKIVTLHVVAPEGQLMHGAHLLEQFEQRGYHFGEMNIFHSMHEGNIVFSVAKLVKPGSFDIRDVDSFQTPGISLILQLPGPVVADVAFEVLLSEAHEIANAMGATVLDADRSTLSKQTVQHMREGINEYLYRHKYSSGVPS